ncbi:MAG: UbiD family decarboxylase [Planctomycetaceae bacterium]|nr:UbiD family decarboxylase [Planctomycetaceae bacterium]
MPYVCLGDFLNALADSGDLVRITAAVDAVLELAAITEQVSKSAPDGGPAILFSNVRSGGWPVVTNLLGNPRRLARALGVQSLDQASLMGSTANAADTPSGWWNVLRWGASNPAESRFTPKAVRQAPCQQVVKLGRDVNLWELPVPRHWPLEPNPSFTAGLVVTPGEADDVTLSRAPLQLIDRQRLLPHWPADTTVWRQVQAARAARRQLPVAIILGGDPLLQIAAAATDWTGLPPGYLWPGSLRGESLTVVKCRSHDLLVPAEAEIVLEGFDDPDAAWESLIGLGLATGYGIEEALAPVIQITAVTHRAGPVLPTIVPAPPPNEETWIRHAVDRLFLPAIRQLSPDIIEFHRPVSGARQQLAFVSVRKPRPHAARSVMHAIWGCPGLRDVKMIVVVDAAINPQHEAAVWNAAALHVDPRRDVVLADGPTSADDHAAVVRGVSGKLGLDATAKRPDERHPRVWPQPLEFTDETWQQVAGRWSEFGLPAEWGTRTTHSVFPAPSPSGRGLG